MLPTSPLLRALITENQRRKNEAPGGVLRDFRYSLDHGAIAAVQHAVLRHRVGGFPGHVRLVWPGPVGGSRAAADAEV